MGGDMKYFLKKLLGLEIFRSTFCFLQKFSILTRQNADNNKNVET